MISNQTNVSGTASGYDSMSVASPSLRLPLGVRVGSEATAIGPSTISSDRAHNFAPTKGREGRLDKRSLVMVVTQLSIMTKSGVDLADAVNSIARKTTNHSVRESLTAIHVALEEGMPLSKAMAAQGNRYDGVTIASVAAGEASGKLPGVLARLSTLMRDDLRVSSSIRSLISYPLVLVLVTFSVLVAMMFVVLPQFGSIYENSQSATPVITQMMLDTSTVLRNYWWVVAGLIALSVGIAWRLLRSTAGRLWIDKLCFRAPLLRSVSQYLVLGRVFRLQGVLLESGVPLLEVLQLTKQVSSNSVVRQLNSEMQESVLVGRKMSAPLQDTVCAPEGALEMVATAEANGQLPSVLQTVGEYFESEGEQRLRELIKVAEPTIIVFLGVVVGAIVLAVMLPMLNLSTAGV